MAAYRADIEIGVKGQEAIGRLQKQLDGTLYKINQLNRTSVFRTGNVAQNIDRYTKQLDKAAIALDRVAMGTIQETRAIANYVTAMGNANAARARQNYLIEQEIANRRKVQATVNAGFGQQGAALPPSMRNAGFGQLGPALPPAAKQSLAGGNKNISKAFSSAAIGGAFPLLFGQSGAAAAGGAIGGIAGELLGPIGGFGGSLIGTLIGEKLGQGNKVKELANDIGFSAEQTKMLGAAFQQAGRDFDKFQASVSTIQGLSLSIEDQARAIQLASTLTAEYGGKIDKVTNAFANALSTGKVTQGTLNQLTSQGIPIQQALADKYNISRSAIVQMAKDGKISVQDLIDTLVEVGNKAEQVGAKQTNSFATASEAVDTATTKLNTALTPAYALVTEEVAKLIQKIADVTTAVANFVTYSTPALSAVINAFDGINTAIGNASLNLPLLSSAINTFAEAAYSSLFPIQALLDRIAKQGKGPGFLGAGKYAAPSNQVPIPEPLKSFIAPSQAVPSSNRSAADKAAKAAEREAARVANIVRDRAVEVEILRQQSIYAEQLVAAELNKDPILKSQLQTTEKLNEISLKYSKDINDEKAKGNSITVKEAITKKALAEIEKTRFEGALDIAKIEISRAENYQNIIMDLDQELKLKSATTEQAREQLRIDYEIKKLQQTNAYTPDQLTAIQSRKQALAAPKTPAEIISSQLGLVTDELTNLLNVGNQVVTIAGSIGDAFGTSFKGVIDGTMTAQQALASFFQSVASAFLDMAAKIIAKWIEMTILNSILQLFPGSSGLTNAGGTGFDMGSLNGVGMEGFNPSNSFNLAARAAGGPVSAGMPYMVGEKGPELFLPRNSGTIIPNNALGGGTTNVVVNVDASGSSVQGDQTQAKQLGTVISAAVQAELVKQQRPGGLLAGTRR